MEKKTDEFAEKLNFGLELTKEIGAVIFGTLAELTEKLLLKQSGNENEQ